MSADLTALDRGLVELGVLAAEDRARIERLEYRVNAIFTMMREATLEAGLPVPDEHPKPHLTVVPR